MFPMVMYSAQVKPTRKSQQWESQAEAAADLLQRAPPPLVSFNRKRLKNVCERKMSDGFILFLQWSIGHKIERGRGGGLECLSPFNHTPD